MNPQYEVLNPWAASEPVALHGISPRLNDLAGKTIGLFHHSKLAGPYITSAVEKALKKRFPTANFSNFRYPRLADIDNAADKGSLGIVPVDPFIRKTELDEFEKWINSVDAVVGAVGD